MAQGVHSIFGSAPAVDDTSGDLCGVEYARQVGPGVICMGACLLDRGRLQRGWLLVSD
jgi:hypothetical protein